MRRKINVSRSEMLQLREQGLSNRDIAGLLDVSVATVIRYIGTQGRRMDSLAAFTPPKMKQEEQIPEDLPESSPRAVDKLELAYEIVKSADGTFSSELDYESKSCSLLNASIAFDKLPELLTFMVGLAGRVANQQEAARTAFE